jgi:hypothetical protein
VNSVALLVLGAAWVLAQPPAEVRGKVVDARGGEALSQVVVQLAGTTFRATTDRAGRFRIPAVPPGDYLVNVSTVGYHLVKKAFHLDAGQTQDFEVILSPETYRQTDRVDVQASPFEPARQDSPSALVLGGNDAKNLASVLADDPLRAVQNLPGVSSNNDFDARFSLRGADFDRIGLYLDQVLLHAPFHMLQGQQVSGSATAFNGDMVEELELHDGAFPVRYQDRSAGILDVHTRDGNRHDVNFRIAASASNAGVMAEGPWGEKKRGSWLVGARKSYLQYIFERTFPDSSYIFGFEDAQGRLSYDLTPKNHITLYLLESFSSLDRHQNLSSLGINSLVTAGYHYTFGNLGWRTSPTQKLLIQNHAAWMREKYDNHNQSRAPLAGGFYGEWVWNTDATWMWSQQTPLDAGFSFRRLRSSGFNDQYQTNSPLPRLLDRSDGTAAREGGYAQQSWLPLGGMLHFTFGARWDRHSLDRVTAVSPQASAAIALPGGTRIQLGFGEYVQYPELTVLTSILGSRALLPMRSKQVIAAVEQRLSTRLRLRAEYYDRMDRDMIFQPLYDTRLVGTRIVPGAASPVYLNSLRGYSRGFEFFVQRASANGFTGWASYAFGRTENRDGFTGNRFPSDFDQRHTLNLYGSYRLRPSVNLSMKFSYGSGFPIPGYLTQSNGLYYLSGVRNQDRMQAYLRTDLRVNKSWTKDRWKLTLFGEVINWSNRTNYIYDSFNGYNPTTGQALITLDTMFPILPSAGIVFER